MQLKVIFEVEGSDVLTWSTNSFAATKSNVDCSSNTVTWPSIVLTQTASAYSTAYFEFPAATSSISGCALTYETSLDITQNNPSTYFEQFP